MTAAASPPSRHLVQREHGAPSPPGLSDLQRWAANAALPRHCRAIVAELARVADWSTWTTTSAMWRFAAGYSIRHTRRALRVLEGLGIVSTTWRPHITSRYQLDTRRLEHLAATVRDRVAEARARDQEERRAEQGAELEDLGDVPGVVRQVLGGDQAARMGWSVRRANRLHRNLGAPSLEDWRGQWERVAPELEGLAEAPGWLWRADAFAAHVQHAIDSDAGARFEAERLAELARLHPPGELHKFGTRSAWSRETRNAGPRMAHRRLVASPVFRLVAGWTALRYDGPHLVLAAPDPEALALALELLDASTIEAEAGGPIALTWTH